jgi:hypothetical protein
VRLDDGVFFGICVGALIALSITYPQIPMTDPNRPYYFAALLTSIGLSVLSGIAGIGGYVRANGAKKKLYKEAIPLEPPKISN